MALIRPCEHRDFDAVTRACLLTAAAPALGLRL